MDMNGVLSAAFDEANKALRVVGAVDQLLIPPNAMTLTGATLVATDVPTVQFANAATQSAQVNFTPSKWWRQMGVGLIISRRGAEASADVRWRVAVKTLNIGFDVITEAFAADVSANLGVPAQNGLGWVVDQVANLNVEPAAFGATTSILVQRIGADAGDTFTGAVDVIGILLRRNPAV